MKKIAIPCLLAGVACLVGSYRAARADQQPVVPAVPHALGLYITERGQTYLGGNLMSLLSTPGGLDIAHFRMSKWKHETHADLSANGPDAKKYSDMLNEIRECVKDALRDHNETDQQIRVKLMNFGYDAGFNNVGLSVDQRQSSVQGGIVADFDVEVSSLKIQTDSLDAYNLGGGDLHHVGAKHAVIELQSGSKPLHIQFAVNLKLNDAKDAEVKFLGLTTNLPEVDLNLRFDSPLQFPETAIWINGKKWGVKKDHIEDELLEPNSALVKEIQGYLENMISESLPAALSDTATQALRESISQPMSISPVGAPGTVAPEDDFLLGMKAEELSQKGPHVFLGLSASSTDPHDLPFSASGVEAPLRSLPTINQLSPADYDMAFTVNEDLVNRLVALSYHRGYFHSMAGSDGQPVEILDVPRFHFDGSAGHDHGRLHVRVAENVHGLEENLAIRKRIIVEMDMGVQLTLTSDHNIKILLDSIDMGTVRLDNSTIKKLFKKKVRATVMGILRSASEDLGTHPISVMDSLPLSSVIGHLSLEVKDFQVDPNGFVVLFMNFVAGT